MPAKPPLPEDAVFKRNQAAADRWRGERKARYNEKEIAKCD
jgi:hypothetical protein